MFDNFESFEKATTAWRNMDGQKTLKYFWSPMPNLNVTGCGIDLDYCDIEWFALEMNRDHLLLGKSHGWRSLLGCNPWGH